MVTDPKNWGGDLNGWSGDRSVINAARDAGFDGLLRDFSPEDVSAWCVKRLLVVKKREERENILFFAEVLIGVWQNPGKTGPVRGQHLSDTRWLRFRDAIRSFRDFVSAARYVISPAKEDEFIQKPKDQDEEYDLPF